jgi:hypothetical protein
MYNAVVGCLLLSNRNTQLRILRPTNPDLRSSLISGTLRDSLVPAGSPPLLQSQLQHMMLLQCRLSHYVHILPPLQTLLHFSSGLTRLQKGTRALRHHALPLLLLDDLLFLPQRQRIRYPQQKCARS